MKYKQAIERLESIKHEIEYMLKNYKFAFNDTFSDDDIQALDLAIESLEELTRLNQHITSLAHYWGEKDDKAFKERLQVIEREYRAKGKEDLAEYIRVQYSDCMCWCRCKKIKPLNK